MHEIQNNDHLVLARNAAWHGLGTVVKEAPNPFAALRLARLEWTVEESASITGIYNPGEETEFRVSTDTAKVLVRSDDKSVLGVVGPDYTPVQNETLAELAYGLRDVANNRNVQVESAGSLRGGKRVYFLLRGETLEMGAKNDLTNTYFLLTNGNDGGQSLMGLGTGTRVVCANTHRIALGQATDRIAFRHTSGIASRVDELAKAINNWQAAARKGKEFADALGAKPLTKAEIQSLWTDVIQRLDGPIPTNPKNGWEENRRERAVAGLAHMAQVFDREAKQFGATAWVAANAATNWVQHARQDYALRTKDAAVRTYDVWQGSTADDIAEVWQAAKALA